jgi:outer membrane protein
MTSIFRHPRRAALLAAVTFVATRTAAAQGTPNRVPVRDTVVSSRTNASAQGVVRSISLDEATKLAEERSEGVRIAQAGLLRARGQAYQARSQYLPQFSGSLAFTKTLASQFEEISKRAAAFDKTNPPADTTRPLCTLNAEIPRNASQPVRDAGLQTATTDCGATGLENSPIAKIFAAPQTLTFGLVGSMNLFTGGRIIAANRIATSARHSAEIGYASALAALRLQVTEAYYDALLSDRLATIADSSLRQSERTLAQVRLARNVGNTSEFELLRAQVTSDNQRPLTIQRHTTRDLALLRLKQLLDLPASDSLALTSDLADSTLAGGSKDARTISRTFAALASASDTSAESRSTVRQLAEAVKIQQNSFRIARAQRIPSLSLSTQYGRTAYPSQGIPSLHDFFPSWTVTGTLAVPLFTGGRITGDEMIARANLLEARENYQQVKELAALDARSTIAQLEQAVAEWTASQGTAEQAARAYRIAEVRYGEGISTQLELSESRILLQSAQANRAFAARNLRVAQQRLALLRDLPLAGQQSTVTSTQQSGGATTQQQSGASQGQSSSPTQSAGGTTNTNSFGGQQP